MARSSVDRSGDVATVLDAVAAAYRSSSDPWFPELAGRAVHVDLVRLENRPRCFLYFLRLSDGRRERPVLVKVRHSIFGLRRRDTFAQQRPVLTPERTLPDLDTAQREADGLRLIADVFGPLAGPEFGVLRVLAWLPEHLALVMDQVSEPTLRHTLMAQSRLRLLRRPPDLVPWRHAGAWLRIYHGARTDLSLMDRTPSREVIVALFDKYADFLQDVVGHGDLFRNVAPAAAEVAASALPERLPLSVGHGDFTPRNLFAAPSGRITVFDPMPLWRVPVYEDLVRFLVGVRLLGLQAVSQGFAFSQSHLDGIEAAYLAGYFGDAEVPLDAVRSYQVLILFDKWAAMASKQKNGPRALQELRRRRVQIVNRYYAQEARRLYALLLPHGSEGVSRGTADRELRGSPYA